ncbi:hypothetical protein, partial [Phocaeicola sp.]|uniref:hypothetical protein n=1 Tax=Phocaeicola sp. TaxID=2773926 RepID=UPI003AB4F3E4
YAYIRECHLSLQLLNMTKIICGLEQPPDYTYWIEIPVNINMLEAVRAFLCGVAEDLYTSLQRGYQGNGRSDKGLSDAGCFLLSFYRDRYTGSFQENRCYP